MREILEPVSGSYSFFTLTLALGADENSDKTTASATKPDDTAEGTVTGQLFCKTMFIIDVCRICRVQHILYS